MDKLRISQNSRYLVNADGTPFIWLADTAWTMPQRMKWDDVEYYMKKRRSQGFTVLQIVALDPEQDVEMRNPAGVKALANDNPLTPDEHYFEYLDWIIAKADEYGFHILLLPVWGQLVVGENWMGQTFDKTIHEGNSFAYGRWIGNRYKDAGNIIWCLGGDRQPVHKGVDYKNVWRRLAEGLAKGITGRDLKYNEPSSVWKDLLITYHACHEMETGLCSTFSYWTDEDSWISFIMLQSGHGLKPKNYELVKHEYDRAVTMPVWDGEPAYEMMPTSWPVITSFHDDWIVRKRAYWSLFAGSFGHTYGHSSIWCMISEKERDFGRSLSWFESLECPGAWQMKVLRDFLESRDLSRCVPAQEILLQQSQKENDVQDEHRQACRQVDGEFICVYFPSRGSESIDISSMKSVACRLWWFNPKDGQCYGEDNVHTQEPVRISCDCGVLELATPRAADARQDWVLVIDRDGQNLAKPGVGQEYGQVEKSRPSGKFSTGL
jgi:hypothetical protein